ncbi:hypothetical protein IB274_03180 [Pseudomonas sp. PDM18]|uniref:hypothetical protein n=1 Tax=Pseudomonas sp. PDM18 TaxID=2769253 RepID=UPI00177D52AD|nr:hypothetical protein [Pseudomonas sp. PDM18]MBD9675683.1 hypothetical protein [Pseudomonas sp. PDM18]
MTKSLIELSQDLLSKFLDPNGNPVSGRISKPENFSEEAEALREIVAGDSWQSHSGAKAFDFLHENSYCIALNFSLSEEEIEHLEDQSEKTIKVIDVPGSIFLFLANRLGVSPKNIEPLWIEEYIAGPAASKEGVALDVLKENIEGISVFKLNDASIFHSSTSGKYVANYLCTFDPTLNNKTQLSQRSLELIREIFLQEKENLIEYNLFESMSTPLLRHAFLEIYRTLEFVYVLPRAKSLLQQLRQAGGTLDIKVLDFARHCHKELGWKRVERDSVSKLFREYSTSNYGSFIELFSHCKPFSTELAPSIEDDENMRLTYVSKAAEKYYALRNQVAHQFWPDEMLLCDNEDWQALIEFTLGCITYIYNQHLTKQI